MNTILNITGKSHPKAEITNVDSVNGVVYFQWLDAAGVVKGSGNRVATFIPSWSEEDGVRTYIEPTEAELITAIQAT